MVIFLWLYRSWLYDYGYIGYGYMVMVIRLWLYTVENGVLGRNYF